MNALKRNVRPSHVVAAAVVVLILVMVIGYVSLPKTPDAAPPGEMTFEERAKALAAGQTVPPVTPSSEGETVQ